VPQTSATILVVEDAHFVRKVTCEILRHAGYRVLQAECAVTARRVFRRYGKRIDLLLCDAVLPDSSGILLAQSLRRQNAGLTVVLVSGYAGRARDVDQEIGNEFLAKPYCAASLVLKVHMALQKDGSRRDQIIQI
jgi:DNA-binding NtrC family response regulator